MAGLLASFYCVIGALFSLREVFVTHQMRLHFSRKTGTFQNGAINYVVSMDMLLGSLR